MSYAYRASAEQRYALRRFVRASEEQARAFGITPQQYVLLLLVRGHSSAGAITIGDLAEWLQVRHHSASLLVERDVRRGLVRRRRDPLDHRRRLVSLTALGKDILDSVWVRCGLTSRRQARELAMLLGVAQSHDVRAMESKSEEVAR